MHRNKRRRRSANATTFAAVIAGAALLAAGPAVSRAGEHARGRVGAPGAVYLMSNSAGGNEILAYSRAANGMLSGGVAYPTGGLGTSDGLGNQGGVELSKDHGRLFVVNAGSNDISAFEVTPNGLMLTDLEPSLGEHPVSVTSFGDLLYVLHAGGAGSIQGFTIDASGDIIPLSDSMRPLSGAAMTGPAQIAFSPDGGVLVVTEKATSIIDTYVVHEDGRTSGPNSFDSAGQTPFGFDFTSRGNVLVSEAFGGAEGQAAASSYHVSGDGMLTVVSPTVQSFQTASCWLVVAPTSRYAYTTNTPAGTLSGYVVSGRDDSISLLDADGVTLDVGEGTGPLDAAFTTNGRFLYTLNSGTHEIGVHSVNQNDGSLTSIQVVPGLPTTANGMAAH